MTVGKGCECLTPEQEWKDSETLGKAAADQIRTASVERLIEKMTTLEPRPACAILPEILADRSDPWLRETMEPAA